jgi:hypothetical protein
MQREINMNRMTMVLVLSLLLAGCAAPAAEATPLPTATPLERFEILVAANSHFTFSPAPGNNKPPYIKTCADIHLVDVSYDVETTDSLVSPYLGTIVYTVQRDLTQSGPKTFTITDIYALQSEAWTLKDTQLAPDFIPLLSSGHCVMSRDPLP